MAIPSWPSDLPQNVLVDGYASGPPDARHVTDMERGPPKVRRLGGPGFRPVACAIQVEANGYARFERFWQDDTIGGVLPFVIRDQILDGHALLDEDGAPLLTEDDAPLLISAYWLAQFGRQAPAYSAVGSFVFRIAFDLIVLP